MEANFFRDALTLFVLLWYNMASILYINDVIYTGLPSEIYKSFEFFAATFERPWSRNIC